jgi:threonyl-tRNA synthetase
MDFRPQVDDASETVGNKIRKAVNEKVPYILVIGDKEMESGLLNVRERGSKNTYKISKEDFIKNIQSQIK